MDLDLVLSLDAIHDIDQAVIYYNGLSQGLGLEFVHTIDRYMLKIQRLPSASAIRYNQVRVKPIDTPSPLQFTIPSTPIHKLLSSEYSILIKSPPINFKFNMGWWLTMHIFTDNISSLL